MTQKTFLKFWLSCAAVVFGAIVAFNYLIDPYLLYGHPPFEGLNKIKPAAGTHSSQSKIYAARRSAPDVLIIGNSRPEMGLNPDHAYFKNRGLSVYNMGQPGSGLSTQYGYALDLLRDHDIKQVLIAVDFLDFVTAPDTKSDPYAWPPEKRATDNRRKYLWDGSLNDGYLLQSVKDLYFPLIALSTFRDSLLTVANQSPMSTNLLPNGFNPAQDMHQVTRHEGVRALFGQKVPLVYKSFTSRQWKTDTAGYSWSPDLNKLRFLLQYLKAHNIETKLFINPYHIQYLDIIDLAGLTPEFWLWKKRLATMIAELNAPNTLSLWDFSTPSAYTTEPILTAGKTPLKWFWEPAHYTQALGDLVLERLFIRPENKATDFGHPLTQENIAQYHRKYKASLAQYHLKYPEEYRHLKAQLPLGAE